jgi:hypothetical protein
MRACVRVQLWMAPEVMLNLGTNEKSDVYSWGLILWQLLTREKEPYSHYNTEPYEEGLRRLRENVAVGTERPPIPDWYHCAAAAIACPTCCGADRLGAVSGLVGRTGVCRRRRR